MAWSSVRLIRTWLATLRRKWLSSTTSQGQVASQRMTMRIKQTKRQPKRRSRLESLLRRLIKGSLSSRKLRIALDWTIGLAYWMQKAYQNLSYSSFLPWT